MRKTASLVFLLCCATWLQAPTTVSAAAFPVELRQTSQGWQLLRGGEPYFIRGAGGNSSFQQLVEAGGNSIRTWGADDRRWYPFKG